MFFALVSAAAKTTSVFWPVLTSVLTTTGTICIAVDNMKNSD